MRVFSYAQYCQGQYGSNDIIASFQRLTCLDSSTIHNTLSRYNPELITGSWFDGASIRRDDDFTAISRHLFKVARITANCLPSRLDFNFTTVPIKLNIIPQLLQLSFSLN